jgi:uncharacterized iron-regulated membrane protein
MKSISKKIFFIAILCLLFVSVLPVFAQKEELQNFGKAAYGEATATAQQHEGYPIVIAGNIVNVFLGILGIVTVVLILYGGFLWMTAAGNEQRIEKAKKILEEAIIGLVIIVMAYAISYFVINQLLKASGAPG